MSDFVIYFGALMRMRIPLLKWRRGRQRKADVEGGLEDQVDLFELGTSESSDVVRTRLHLDLDILCHLLKTADKSTERWLMDLCFEKLPTLALLEQQNPALILRKEALLDTYIFLAKGCVVIEGSKKLLNPNRRRRAMQLCNFIGWFLSLPRSEDVTARFQQRLRQGFDPLELPRALARDPVTESCIPALTALAGLKHLFEQDQGAGCSVCEKATHKLQRLTGDVVDRGMLSITRNTHFYNLAAYRYQRDKPGSTRPNVPKEEWSMYPTPLGTRSSLQIVVEILEKESKEICNVLLYVKDGGNDHSGGVTLEEIDLKSFSQPGIAHSSPLKAVHGGKQLGFRYVHPLDGHPSVQFYKRFQLTFKTVEEAEAVAASIRLICPCTSGSTQQNQQLQQQQRNQQLMNQIQIQQKSDMPAPKRRKLEARPSSHFSSSSQGDAPIISVGTKKHAGLFQPPPPPPPQTIIARAPASSNSKPMRPISSISSLLNAPMVNPSSTPHLIVSFSSKGTQPDPILPLPTSMIRPPQPVSTSTSSTMMTEGSSSALTRIDDLFRIHRPSSEGAHPITSPSPSPSSPMQHHHHHYAQVPSQPQPQSQSQSLDIPQALRVPTQTLSPPPPTTTSSSSSVSLPAQTQQIQPSSFPAPVPSSGERASTSEEEPVDLNTLSQTDLESLVVKVINEPGFDELMEKLNKVFVLRAYLK
ncbi:hypothetical protein FRC17_009940 [Serendipita sp. 399]|nr:hypothetical protein FRC17_009940 [Serendipita sp. 399]